MKNAGVRFLCPVQQHAVWSCCVLHVMMSTSGLCLRTQRSLPNTALLYLPPFDQGSVLCILTSNFPQIFNREIINPGHSPWPDFAAQ